jgi:NADH pyrophosphatase NudC (nudix superfamily)
MPTFKFCPVCTSPFGLRQLPTEDRQRLVCSNASCGYVHYDNPTPVVAAIVEQDGMVVLARNQRWPTHWYGLITGFLEKKETPEEAVLREVQEELGLTAELVSLVGLYTFDWMNQLIIAYHVRAEAGAPITLNEELADYKYITPQDLQPWDSGTGHAVRDWLAARGIVNETISLKR